jgi:hypothetical protein
LYIKRLNDRSFTIGEKLVILVEHQSTLKAIISPRVKFGMLAEFGHHSQRYTPCSFVQISHVPMPRSAMPTNGVAHVSALSKRFLPSNANNAPRLMRRYALFPRESAEMRKLASVMRAMLNSAMLNR